MLGHEKERLAYVMLLQTVGADYMAVYQLAPERKKVENERC